MASENYVQEKIEESASRFFSCPEAEESIIRRMLMKRGTAEDVVDELSGKDFSDITLGRLFSAIKLVVQAGAQVDLISVDDAFSRRFPKNADAIRTRMVDVTKFKQYTVADSQSIDDHIRIVRDLAARRAAISCLDEVSQALRDPSIGLDEALSQIRENVDKVDAGNDVWTPMSDVLLNSYEYVEQVSEGKVKAIPTGIRELDEMLGGFYGGELSIVAARPSVGKSAFAANIAMAAALEGFKVGIVSLEMTDINFGQRLLSRGSGVDGGLLRRGKVDVEAWTRLADALNTYSELPISFMFSCNHIEDVCAAARRRAKHGDLQMLIVDYIGIMQTRKRFRELREKIGYISWSLKQLALETKIPVIALAQVNRDAQGTMPTMANLRDSGNIEQDADGIMFLHRVTIEDKSLTDEEINMMAKTNEDNMGLIKISVAKQRQGKVGTVSVAFTPSIMRYTSVDWSSYKS